LFFAKKEHKKRKEKKKKHYFESAHFYSFTISYYIKIAFQN